MHWLIHIVESSEKIIKAIAFVAGTIITFIGTALSIDFILIQDVIGEYPQLQGVGLFLQMAIYAIVALVIVLIVGIVALYAFITRTVTSEMKGFGKKLDKANDTLTILKDRGR